MGYELIISEKPDAAKKIAQALADGKPLKQSINGVPYYQVTHQGRDLVVASAVGHLFTVAEKNKSFDYPVFDIHWVPAADVDKSAAFSRKYLKALEKLSKKASSFVVACDYDVEGEVIGLNVVRFVCKQDDAQRMKFSTLTPDDLREAYSSRLPSIDWGQALAGETRHFLDWLYGINLSRALMHAVRSAGGFQVLSSGRVQGPALKIIVDREKEILSFKPVPYWQLELTFSKDGVQVRAFHEKDKFWDKGEAEKALLNAKDKELVVKDLIEKEFKQLPPVPFDLGSLQSEAYALFGIPPKRTLQAAQNLYLAGVTSYPRTSSQKLPFKIGFKKILSGLAKQEEFKLHAESLLNKSSLKPREGKKDDPAHPAIYPTGLVPKGLKGDEEKIYRLIVRRFLAVFGDPAVRKTVTASLDVGGEVFVAKGTVTVVKGWHELYAPFVRFKEEVLPVLVKGESLPVDSLTLLDKETSPPKRFTPSSIISELEKRGLGTKATRADIVEALYQRNYIEGQSIKATELGMKIVDTLEKFCPEILDEELTRHFEEQMELIRERKTKPEIVLSEAKDSLLKVLNHFKENEKFIGEALKTANEETRNNQATLGKCPKCGSDIRIIFSKKNKKRFVACSAYPDCDFTAPLPQKGTIKATKEVCEHDGYPIIVIRQRGKKPQKVCLNTHCKSKNHLSEEEAENAPDCPVCGKKMVLRKSVYGSFWGCQDYPKCKGVKKI